MSTTLQTLTLLTIAVFSIALTSAHVLKNQPYEVEPAPGIYLGNIGDDEKLTRNRRFVEGDQPNLNPSNGQQKNQGWELKPNLQRNDQGTVRGDVSIQNHGKNHDFEASWGQNLKGPQKHSEQWRVGGSYKWP